MSTGKRVLRSFDTPIAGGIGSADPISSSIDTALPLVMAGPAPTTPVLVSTVYQQSLTTPRAVINVAWNEPISGVTEYLVQVADNTTFTGSRTLRAFSTAAALEVDAPTVSAVAYSIRVAALYGPLQSDWSSVLSVSVAPDATPPPPVTGLAAVFDANCNLIISWTKPSANNYRDAQIAIYSDSGHTTLYELVYSGSETDTWTVAQNLARTSGVGVDSVYVEVCSRSYSGAYSAPISTTATLPPVATPTLALADFTGPDLLLKWSDSVPVATHRVTLDGQARMVAGREYMYTFATNTQEHAGVPDPQISYSVVAINALGRESAALTGTATNPVPANATGIAVQAGASSVGVSVAYAPEPDLSRFRYTVKKNGVVIKQFDDTAAYTTVTLDASGTYQFSVLLVDVFGQTSAAAVSSSPTTLDILTTAEIRAETMYSDDVGSGDALLAKLKDGNTASDGVPYTGP